MAGSRWLSAEADVFIGRRASLKRYLVCSNEGYFPVAVQTGDQSLAVVYRTGGCHVSITGTLAVSASSDGGKTWSDGVLVHPRWDDVRNPALGVNVDGQLILAYWKAGLQGYEESPNGFGRKWNYDKDTDLTDVPALFVTISKDGGKTWIESEAFGSEWLSLASPYGRIITAADGSMLMSVYGTSRAPEDDKMDICTMMRSYDGGVTWGDSSIVAKGYNETSFALMPDGRLIGAARSAVGGHVAVLFSSDMGRTWTEPVQVTRDGEHPADITVLQSGKLLLTFGRRIRPLGCGALISEDGGQTWNTDKEILLAGDGIENFDLGYPSTVQFKDGNIVTCLYFASGSNPSSDPIHGWGRISCQAIHYREEQII